MTYLSKGQCVSRKIDLKIGVYHESINKIAVKVDFPVRVKFKLNERIE
jgi:hypothetical protein